MLEKYKYWGLGLIDNNKYEHGSVKSWYSTYSFFRCIGIT